MFVTVKTVEMHPGNVYRKLDINSARVSNATLDTRVREGVGRRVA